MINIKVNELPVAVVENSSIARVAAQFKPDADLMILDGFPASADMILQNASELYLIKRGEKPDLKELERLMAARHTPGVHQRLKQATIGVAGAGGLGSAIAVALARVGIGKLVIADFDVVEPSNLNRQQYFIDQIGMFKVDALAENLARINPFTTVEQHNLIITNENVLNIFMECKIVIEAFDKAEMKAMLVESVLEHLPDAFIIAASGLAGYDSNNSITTRKISSRLYLVGDGVSEAKPGNGLMAPRVGIAASHQANQAVRIILGEDLC